MFSDLLDEAEDMPEEPEENEAQGEKQDDAEMVYSSDDDAEIGDDEKGEDQKADDPMGEEKEDEPDSKRRKIVKMIESIPDTAKIEGICLACGNAGHIQCRSVQARKISQESPMPSTPFFPRSKCKSLRSQKQEEHSKKRRRKKRRLGKRRRPLKTRQKE